MPVYEFRCRECGKISEKLCRLGESGEIMTCPNCGGSVQKIFSLIQRPSGRTAGAAGGSSCGLNSDGSCTGCH